MKMRYNNRHRALGCPSHEAAMTIRPATLFLRMALRRAARGTGSPSSFFERRTAMQPIPDLQSILAPTPWVLVGGLALRAYMPERMTLDIDILIHERDSAPARVALLNAGYHVIGQLSIGGFSVQMDDPVAPPIDVLTRADPWLDAALAQPVADPAGYPVLSRPYLILLKLQAGRTQDLADVQRLLAYVPQPERDSMRQIVLCYAPELVEDYDSLCTLADLEFGPPPGEAS
jgi:hypothetical protein